MRLAQEVLGHANLNTLQVYTKIVDAPKEAAYKRYGAFLRKWSKGKGMTRPPTLSVAAPMLVSGCGSPTVVSTAFASGADESHRLRDARAPISSSA